MKSIEKKIKAGQLRVTSFYPDISLRSVSEAEIREFDPNLHSFFNANTPEEWTFALNLLAKGED